MYTPVPLTHFANLIGRWNQMQRRLVATVQSAVGAGRMTNGEATPILTGEIVKQATDGPRRLLRADRNDAHNLGVVTLGCAAGAKTAVQSHGEVDVLFKTGESPVQGNCVFNSDTAGRGSAVPAGAPIGVIIDPSNYATTGLVRCVLALPICGSPS